MNDLKTIKTFGISLLTAAFVLALSGCWSSEELNERAFARTMMLDKTENGIELSLGFPLPNRLAGGGGGGPPGGSAGPSSGQPFVVITKTGRDISEAYRDMQADLSRRITFGQLRHVLVSKAFAQEGLLPVMDFMNRNTEIHINANMLVTDGPAKDIKKIPLTFERFPSDILAAYSKQRTSLIVSAKDVLVGVLTSGDFLLPVLKIGKSGAETEQTGKYWMGTDGSVLFRQGKLVSEFDDEQTRAAMLIMGKTDGMIMQTESPLDGKPFSFLIKAGKTKIKPILNGNRIVMAIRCAGTAKIISTESTLDVTDRKKLAELQKSLNHDLEELIRLTVSFSQAQRADVFNFGERIRWRSPRTWNRIKENWRQTYQEQVLVEAKTDIDIEWFGGGQKPVYNERMSGEEGD